MSYILDALKKADADRERDAAAVPDLYAQADALRGARAAARAPAWVLPASAAGVVALGALGWWWLGSAADMSAPAAPLAQAPITLPSPPPALSTPAPAPTSVPIAPPTAAPPPPQSLPPPAPAPAFVAPAAGRSIPASPPNASITTGAPTIAPMPAPDAPTAATPSPAATATPAPRPASAAEARLPTLAELPADLRSQLPPLSVGGSMYSPNAAGRMVIVNGQVLREGDKPLDGLTVEQIRLKSTVLVFRGVRFELRH